MKRVLLVKDIGRTEDYVVVTEGSSQGLLVICEDVVRFLLGKTPERIELRLSTHRQHRCRKVFIDKTIGNRMWLWKVGKERGDYIYRQLIGYLKELKVWDNVTKSHFYISVRQVN